MAKAGPALTIEGHMKEIIYKGKKVKVPFEDANYTLDGEKDVTIENRFGGENAQCLDTRPLYTM